MPFMLFKNFKNKSWSEKKETITYNNKHKKESYEKQFDWEIED